MTTALLLISRLAMADDTAGTPATTEAPPAPAEPPAAPSEPTPEATSTPAPSAPPAAAPAAQVLPSVVTEARRRGTFSVAIEGGTLATRDPSWSMFSDTAALNGIGARVGYGLGEHLSATVGWQAAQPSPSETQIDVMYDAEPGMEVAYDTSFASTYTGHQVTAGVRYFDTERSGVVVYGGLDLGVMLAKVTLDTDVDRDDPLGELSRSAVAFGGIGTVGLRVPVRVDPKLVLAPYAELGYGAHMPVRFEDLGALDFGGLAARGGIALDF